MYIGPPIGSAAGYKSNASLSKDAKQASNKAHEASGVASDKDPSSHNLAQEAHWHAAHVNRACGNESAAKDHEKCARVHGEKAQRASRAKMFAQDAARDADTLSAKAGKSKFGADPDDPRSSTELHTDAATAHTHASKAFDMAGMKRDSAYHAAKAKSHLQKA